jgi:hypothetical protein
MASVITNKLTLWSWALHESPPVRLLDSFPAFYGTRRFNTEFTRALHLFLSWARQIQSSSPHPTSPRAIRTLSTHLRPGHPSGGRCYTVTNYDSFCLMFVMLNGGQVCPAFCAFQSILTLFSLIIKPVGRWNCLAFKICYLDLNSITLPR